MKAGARKKTVARNDGTPRLFLTKAMNFSLSTSFRSLRTLILWQFMLLIIHAAFAAAVFFLAAAAVFS